MMNFSHSNTTDWGKLRKLHFWKWGITADWNYHRFIFRIGGKK